MEDLTIKIDLFEKELFFNQEKIKLAKSLIDAEECIEENKGEKCVDIIYDNNKEIYNEAIRTIRFMRENKLGKQLRIRAYEYKNDAVQIRGKYNLEIIRPCETPWEILTQQ